MSRSNCTAKECDREQVARGYCHKHWKRWRATGTVEMGRPNHKGMNEVDRFFMYVDKNGPIHPIFQSPCWLWQGGKITGGYAVFRRTTGVVGPVKILVHRYSFELFYYAIPEGMEIDHMCKTRHCVNPQHLDLVTRLENIRRSNRHKVSKMHCINGHRFTPENTYFAKGRLHRACRTCQRASARRQREKQKNVTV